MNLNSQEQIALKEFTGFLASRLSDNYLYSCLFGSKARGDAREDSDLDVAVLLKRSDYQTKCTLKISKNQGQPLIKRGRAYFGSVLP